ncbi:MAG TPA: hypothetical protein VM509_14660 [Planctomycetota bacterium]|nr:hypothetical protein [Planctomycetota bacterium]
MRRTATGAAPDPRRAGVWLGASLVLLSLLVFSNVLGADYVLDGVRVVRDNPLLTPFDPLEIARLDWWEGTGRPGGLYRPVALTWLALLKTAAGGGPGLIDFANVVLHGVVAWLHFVLLARLLGQRPGARAIAWLAALVALVHPLNAEVVAGQVGASDLLASLFLLGGVLIAQRGTLPRFLLAAACAALAALSKESGVLVVPLAVLFEALRDAGEGEQAAWKRRAARAFAWSSLGVAAAFACRFAAIGSLASVDDPVYAGFTATARCASACAAFATHSLPLLFAPWRQLAVVSHQDVAPAAGFGDPRALLGASVLLLLAILPIFALRRGRRELAFGAWIFLAAWLPTSNLLFSSGAIAASRFFYAGLFALGLPLAVFVHAAWSRAFVSRTLAAIAAAWFVLVLGALSFRESGIWRTHRRLLEAQVERAPHSLYGLVDLASLLGAAEPERAKALDTVAANEPLPLIPGTTFPPEDLLEAAYAARTGLAQLAEARGDLEAAEMHDREAAELAQRGCAGKQTLSFQSDWSRNRAFALQQLAAKILERAKAAQGGAQVLALAEAERALDASDACEPDAPEAIRLRSILLQARGDPDGRRQLVEAAWRRRPADPLLRILWANELRQQGRASEALELELDVATEAFDQFDPRRSLTIGEAGLASREPRTAARARALLERLVRLGPTRPDLGEVVREAAQRLRDAPDPSPIR